MSRRTLPLLLSSVLAAVLLLGALVAPVPYVALGPGPTFNTLGDTDGKPVIDITGREVFPADGHLDLTTVGVRAPLSLGEALLGWVRSTEAVVPRELVFPPGRSSEQIDADNARQMSESQEAAVTAALSELGIPLQVAVGEVTPGGPADGVLEPGDLLTGIDGSPVTGPAQLRTLIADRRVGADVLVGYRRGQVDRVATVTTASSEGPAPRPLVGVTTEIRYPFTITIALDDVGGPSAGLMFALGILDKLEPGSLTGGAYVAGTGEITPEGSVRPIGGIQQKLRAARDKGATLFLVPTDNCRDAVGARPDGLTLARVGSLDEGLAALAAVRAGTTPVVCS